MCSVHRKHEQAALALSLGQQREGSVHSWQTERFEVLSRRGGAVYNVQHNMTNAIRAARLQNLCLPACGGNE